MTDSIAIANGTSGELKHAEVNMVTRTQRTVPSGVVEEMGLTVLEGLSHGPEYPPIGVHEGAFGRNKSRYTLYDQPSRQ